MILGLWNLLGMTLSIQYIFLFLHCNYAMRCLYSSGTQYYAYHVSLICKSFISYAMIEHGYSFHDLFTIHFFPLRPAAYNYTISSLGIKYLTSNIGLIYY